jgi:hypothetical protein
VYWFARPPYLRRLGAVVLVLVAAVIDLAPRSTISYPFAAADLDAGTILDTGSVEWRDVPDGLLPPGATGGTVTRYPVAQGEPLTASMTSSDRPSIPDGWWALTLPLPEDVVPGQQVQLVVTGGPPQAYAGIVIEPPSAADALSYEDPAGLVAVPSDSAVAVAAGAADGSITVLVGAAP